MRTRAAPSLGCTPRGSQPEAEVRREQGRGAFVSLGFKVGEPSSVEGLRSGRLLGAASSVSWGVGCQYFVFIYWCCFACVGTRTALCQRFTNANTRLLATHLEFSSLFKSTTWAAPVFFTSHSPRAAPGGCPCLMSLIDTTRDTAQDEQNQSQSVTPIDKYIVLL